MWKGPARMGRTFRIGSERKKRFARPKRRVSIGILLGLQFRVSRLRLRRPVQYRTRASCWIMTEWFGPEPRSRRGGKEGQPCISGASGCPPKGEKYGCSISFDKRASKAIPEGPRQHESCG